MLPESLTPTAMHTNACLPATPVPLRARSCRGIRKPVRDDIYVVIERPYYGIDNDDDDDMQIKNVVCTSSALPRRVAPPLKLNCIALGHHPP